MRFEDERKALGREANGKVTVVLLVAPWMAPVTGVWLVALEFGGVCKFADDLRTREGHALGHKHLSGNIGAM